MAEAMPPVSAQDHAQGPEDAPVTLVEYGDYQCPTCRAGFAVVKAVQARLGERLRFVYRHFPLSDIHRHAQAAAEAAEIAGAQGAFWAMHDTLYGHQDALGNDDLTGYAADLGLDADAFRRDLDGHTQAARVRHDFLGGVRSGVHATPSFFVNGELYDGDWDAAALGAALERAAAA